MACALGIEFGGALIRCCVMWQENEADPFTPGLDRKFFSIGMAMRNGLPEALLHKRGQDCGWLPLSAYLEQAE